jgi:hypothetical protein
MAVEQTASGTISKHLVSLFLPFIFPNAVIALGQAKHARTLLPTSFFPKV